MTVTKIKNQKSKIQNIGNWKLPPARRAPWLGEENGKLQRSWGGQSLFEVVFAIAISALVLVAITSLSAEGVRNSSFSKNNALATKYAQEANEWIREKRDADWNNFYAQASGAKKNLGSLNWPPGGACNIPSDNHLCRTITLSVLTPNKTIESIIEVSWSDSQGQHSARAVTRLTNWK